MVALQEVAGSMDHLKAPIIVGMVTIKETTIVRETTNTMINEITIREAPEVVALSILMVVQTPLTEVLGNMEVADQIYQVALSLMMA